MNASFDLHGNTLIVTTHYAPPNPTPDAAQAVSRSDVHLCVDCTSPLPGDPVRRLFSAMLTSSEARAIASAILSAATESRGPA